MANYNNIKLTKSLFYGGMLLLSLSGLLTFTYLQNKDEGTFEDVSATVAPVTQDPIGGSVYKEIKLKWPADNRSWRVNNPLCGHEKCADDPDDPNDPYLVPNRILQFDGLSYVSEPYSANAITANDLGADNIKTEFIIDRWGGHDSNQNEKFNLNVELTDEENNFPANFKYVMPDVNSLPEPRNQYYHHDNVLVEIDKDDLQPGNNTLEGYVGNGSSKGFWQWGWTSGILRFYFNPQTRDHATAEVDVPSTLGENPVVKLKNVNIPSGLTIEKVTYIAYYRGVDEDGDGYFTDWHEAYFTPKQLQTAGSFEISGHIGTSTTGPDYAVSWDTRYVPDQSGASIKLIARVKASNGMWYITPVKTGISLDRNDSSVKMYTATNILEKYGSINNRLNEDARVRIPPSDSGFIDSASEAAMFWRTWNGQDYQWGYNDYSSHFDGLSHAFHQSFYNVPVNKLVAGNGDNDGKVSIRANTEEEHALEIPWPGPVLIVRTGNLLDTPTPTLTGTPGPSLTPTVTPSWSVTPTPTGTPGATLTPTVTRTPGATLTPTVTGTPGATLTPTVTRTPGVTVTPTITPTGTVTAGTPTVTPTGTIIGNVCGKADVDNNGRFDINDFTGFAQAYGDGKKSCVDNLVDYGPCRGRDADRNGLLDINDFGGYGIGFAQRYYPKTSCAL